MRSTTMSQRDEVTRMLEEEAPARADVELLLDGSLLVTLWRPGEVRWHPYVMRRLDRRGNVMREATRTATGWSEFTHHVTVHPPTPFGNDEDMTRWVRG